MNKTSGHSERIPSLDGLRAISIIFVLCGHSIGTRNFPALFRPIGPLAEFGVRVFFVLSGFLITTLLLKELEVSQRISLKNFYLRRVFRIFPASYTYILIISCVAALHLIQLHPHDVLHAVTYTANYYEGRSWYMGHLWSLSVEEQFYLLWPLTLWLAGRRRGMIIAGLVCVVAPFVRATEFAFLPAAHLAIGEWFETVADSLAAGCLLAGMRDWLSQQKTYIRFLSSPFFVIVPILIIGVTIFPPRLRYDYTLVFTAVNLGIALCLDWSLRFPDGVVGVFLNWRPMAFIGVLSYSLYLWQQPFLDRYAHSALNTFPLSVILAFLAALASYYLVEKPFLRLKKRFESGRVKHAAAVSAEAGSQDETASERAPSLIPPDRPLAP